MDRNEGYIKLSRKLFNSDMWETPRTYSSCEAWIDLIQSARFEAAPLTASIGGREIIYGRGQYPASIRFLASRWKWTEKQVRSFLDRLKKQGRITTDCKQGMNIVTLCKYEEYNSSENTSGTAKDTAKGVDTDLIFKELDNIRAQLTAQQRAHEGHSEGTKKKKVNKEKKEENIILSNDNTSDNSDELPVPPLEADVGCRIPFQKIAGMWNATCTGYQQVLKLGEKRKNKIRIRIDEMGGVDKASGMLQGLFDKMQASNFLRGESSRGWKANFDWLFVNGENWVKVLEGRYDNDRNKNVANNGTIRTNVGIDTVDAKEKRDRDFEEHIRSKLGGGD